MTDSQISLEEEEERLINEAEESLLDDHHLSPTGISRSLLGEMIQMWLPENEAIQTGMLDDINNIIQGNPTLQNLFGFVQRRVTETGSGNYQSYINHVTGFMQEENPSIEPEHHDVQNFFDQLNNHIPEIRPQIEIRPANQNETIDFANILRNGLGGLSRGMDSLTQEGLIPILHFRDSSPPRNRRQASRTPERYEVQHYTFQRNPICFVCDKNKVHPSRKFKICTDCFVDILREANIVPRREVDDTRDKTRNQKQTCLICMEDIIHWNRKTKFCTDCLVETLKNNQILKTQDIHREVIVRKVNPIDEPSSVFRSIRPPDTKKSCDLCSRKIIHSKRQNRVCVDCMIEALIQKEIIALEERPAFICTS